jgi:hypothetical protein
MNNQSLIQQSRWIGSLKQFLKIKRVFVLSGNIFDTVLYETNKSVKNMDMNQFLLQFFIDHDFRMVAFCDEFSGFVILICYIRNYLSLTVITFRRSIRSSARTRIHAS